MSWMRSNWKAVVATVVAFMIGAIVGVSGADQQEEIDRKDSRIASLRDDVSDAQTEIAHAEDDLREAQSLRPDALKYRRARSAIKREEAAALRAQRERERQQAEAERQQREAAEQAAQSTIEGDGTWHVGEDFAAGTYRATQGKAATGRA